MYILAICYRPKTISKEIKQINNNHFSQNQLLHKKYSVVKYEKCHVSLLSSQNAGMMSLKKLYVFIFLMQYC